MKGVIKNQLDNAPKRKDDEKIQMTQVIGLIRPVFLYSYDLNLCFYIFYFYILCEKFFYFMWIFAEFGHSHEDKNSAVSVLFKKIN